MVYLLFQIRLQAIKRCEEAIMNAIRLGNPNVLQVGCVTQWNLCLPLLQPNLRHYVRKPLTQVAEALENIQRFVKQIQKYTFYILPLKKWGVMLYRPFKICVWVSIGYGFNFFGLLGLIDHIICNVMDH